MFNFLKSIFKKPRKKTAPQNSKAKVHCNSKTCAPHAQKNQDVNKPECARCNDTTVVAANTAAGEIKSDEAIKAAVEPDKKEEVVEEFKVEETDSCDNKESNADIGSFNIKATKDGIYFFELISKDGGNVITSSEYTLKRSCVSGIQSVKKNGATENVEDQTAEKNVKKPNPKYEVYTDDKSKYRFKLKAPNGYMILTSGAYNSKKACLKAIENVRVYSQSETINDLTK